MKALLGVLLASALLPATGRAVTIGLFADDQCSLSCLAVDAGQTVSFRVAVRRDGASHYIQGAHFSISGVPAGWSAVVVPNPSALLTWGNIFDSAGGAIALAIPPEEDCTTLYDVSLHATTAVADVVLRVGNVDPAMWLPNCPAIVVDEPVDPPFLCVDPGQMLINPVGRCLVGLERISWGRAKATYR